VQTKPIYWRNKSEAELASYQQFQQGNSCAQNSIAALFNLFFQLNFNGNLLAKLVDQIPFFDRLRYRLWSNGPTTPLNQLHLLTDIALYQKVSLSVQLEKGSLELLSKLMIKPRTLTLITLGWLPRQAPVIIRGNQVENFNGNKGLGFHTMLAVAYDPSHQDKVGASHPWGFINSWSIGGTELFWMTTEDLDHSWGFYTPFGGTYPMITVKINTT